MSQNVYIYNGSKNGFTRFVESKLSNQQFKDLTDLAYAHDANSRIFTVKQENQDTNSQPITTFPKISNLVISADEYSGVNESLLFNIEKYVELFQVENLIVHNPPKLLESNLVRAYSEKIKVENEQYKHIDDKEIKEINTTLNNELVGQPEAIEKILINLITLKRQDSKHKPLVILLYGPSGVGKTESAKLIATSLGETLFRKQLSMFQNSDFMTYLFGGKHNEKSLARDLLERESNVILFDEFDKANQVAHSAFYQLFDEGIFEDKNYSVILNDTVIFCTSNYSDIPTIRKELGDPIFSRFDSHIQYNALNKTDIQLIVSKSIDVELSMLNNNTTINKVEVLNKFEPFLSKINNARLARNLVREYFSKLLLDDVLNNNNQ